MSISKVQMFAAQFDAKVATNQVADTKNFRQSLIAYGVQELGFTVASAASAYNAQVLSAIDAGTLVKVKRGVLALRDDVVAANDMKWAVIDKETRKLVRYVASKNKGFATKTEAETVVKAELV